MLKPDKHTNPILSVVNISSMIIEELLINDIVGYEDLITILIKKTSKSVKQVFHYALSFLFLLNKIEYLKDIDAFRLVK